MNEQELFEQERINRLESNHESQKKVFLELLDMCKDSESTLLMIKMLAKKKNQIKLTVRWMYQMIKDTFELKTFPEELPEENINFFTIILEELIEGKLFLEQERIDYSQYLKRVYEFYNLYENALQITYDVPIETFSTIRLEDVSKFQLDILRLAIICQDKVRAEIMTKKIREKHLTDKRLLKLLRTDFYILSRDFLKVTKEIMKIVESTGPLGIVNQNTHTQTNLSHLTLDTINFGKDKINLKYKYFFEMYSNENINTILVQQACIFTILAHYNESSDQNQAETDIQSIRQFKQNYSAKRIEWLRKLQLNIYNVEKMRNLTDFFLRSDIIEKEKCVQELLECYNEHRQTNALFDIDKLANNSVVSHNLAILSSSYSSISFSDLETLLQTPVASLLERITNLDIHSCKIDQRGGFLHFEHFKNTDVTEPLKALEETVMFCLKEKLRRKIEMEKQQE